MHTYAGHAINCAVSLKVIEIMERDRLVEHTNNVGTEWQRAMKEKFGDLPIVGDIRGKGFWQAIDFTSDRKSRTAFTDDTVTEIVRRVRESGVIVGAIGTAIEIAPPYISSQEELDRCTDSVFQAIVDVSRERGLG